MASIAGFILMAILCTANCNPLAEILPNVATTVCESTPNMLANLGLGVGPLGLNLPTSLGLQLLTQSMMPSLGQTTVCDSKTNVGLPVLSPYGLPMNTGMPSQTQTICESASNLPVPYGLGLPGLIKGLNLPGLVNNNIPSSSTTVCESTNNPVSPLNLPLGLSGMLGGGLPFGGLNLPFNGLGLPMNGLGLPMNGLGLSMNGLGLPMNGLGLSVNGLGLPMNGLGLPMNGLGLPLNGLAGLAVNPLGLPML
ncbi:uncharacterized protein LOC112056862 [Bicyclus anynana]|uniref:Uncharacterized protein LOC112056862 n=1 Tax=Bicyclus anynana TaxID=110368 RepID=A0A6J1P5P3_BICAN|nr:uncharacterized protein LOC112056862 [Bicyclus anynana]